MENMQSDVAVYITSSPKLRSAVQIHVQFTQDTASASTALKEYKMRGLDESFSPVEFHLPGRLDAIALDSNTARFCADDELTGSESYLIDCCW